MAALVAKRIRQINRSLTLGKIGWFHVITSVLGAALIGGGVYLIAFQFPQSPEISIGVVIVVAVSALLLLLFWVALGFATLELADNTQALGLPEGSIRALI